MPFNPGLLSQFVAYMGGSSGGDGVQMCINAAAGS